MCTALDKMCPRLRPSELKVIIFPRTRAGESSAKKFEVEKLIMETPSSTVTFPNPMISKSDAADMMIGPKMSNA